MKIRSMLAAACTCLIASGSILSFTTALLHKQRLIWEILTEMIPLMWMMPYPF